MRHVPLIRRAFLCFVWVLLAHIVLFALWEVVDRDLRRSWDIVSGASYTRWLWVGGPSHWTHWLQIWLGRPGALMVYLLVRPAAWAVLGIVLGRLQCSILRKQGYGTGWWMPMALLAPFAAWFVELVALEALYLPWRVYYRLMDVPALSHFVGEYIQGSWDTIIWTHTSDAIFWTYRAANGVGFGIGHWLILRKWARRAWLWLVALAVSETLREYTGRILYSHTNLGRNDLMRDAITGSVRGAIIGVAMIWMLRFLSGKEKGLPS